MRKSKKDTMPMNFEDRMAFHEKHNVKFWILLQNNLQIHRMKNSETKSPYLFVDIETTGLPKRMGARVDDFDNWPRIVEIAWILADNNGKELESESFVLNTDSDIPKEASSIHGITNRVANQRGVNRGYVLRELSAALSKSQLMVAHNVRFDYKIIYSEFKRCSISSKIHNFPKLCTMHSTTDYCMIPGVYGYKFPTLKELYYKIFREQMPDSHSAMGDVKACKKSFFELKQRNIIKRYKNNIIFNPKHILDNQKDLIVVGEPMCNDEDDWWTIAVKHVGLHESEDVEARSLYGLDSKVERVSEKLNRRWNKIESKVNDEIMLLLNMVDNDR